MDCRLGGKWFQSEMRQTVDNKPAAVDRRLVRRIFEKETTSLNYDMFLKHCKAKNNFTGAAMFWCFFLNNLSVYIFHHEKQACF